MKKTLVALSVLMAASASAGVELYNQDGASVSLGGDIEVRYKKAKADGSEYKQEIDDSDLNFDIRYTVNDQLTVGGYWELNDLATKDGEGGDAYVSFITADFGEFKIGKTCTHLDDAGIGSDYTFGLETFFGGSDYYCVDEIVRWDVDKGNFYGGIALAQDKNGDNAIDEDSTYFDGKLGYRIEDFDFTAFYGAGEADQDGDGNAVAKNFDEKTWSLQARFSGVENLELALAYYNMDNETVNVDTIGFAATYAIETIELAAGYSHSKSDADNSDDFGAWYVNAGYPLAPNTTIYAEIGGDNADETELGSVVGIKASF